jgi:hypothetical protein
MTKALSLLILAAAGLAGCAGGTPSPTDTRPVNDRTLPPGEGAFGRSMTWDLSKKEDPAKPAAAPAAAATQASASEQEEFKKWRESVSSPERQEFEEWRAWQEWKRKNPR